MTFPVWKAPRNCGFPAIRFAYEKSHRGHGQCRVRAIWVARFLCPTREMTNLNPHRRVSHITQQKRWEMGALLSCGRYLPTQQMGSSEPEFNRIFARCLHCEDLVFVIFLRRLVREASLQAIQDSYRKDMAERSVKPDQTVR